MTRGLQIAAVAAVLCSGCATVKASHLRPDYERVDKPRLKHLFILVQPLPAQDPKVGELWSLLARRYVDLHRNFIVLGGEAAPADAGGAKARCAQKADGVLALSPQVEQVGEKMKEQVRAQLLRCTDGEEVWSALAEGSWASNDKGLTEVTQTYVTELGEPVRPYVAPSFRLLKATFDAMPNTVLSEDEQSEKIEASQQ